MITTIKIGSNTVNTVYLFKESQRIFYRKDAVKYSHIRVKVDRLDWCLKLSIVSFYNSQLNL